MVTIKFIKTLKNNILGFQYFLFYSWLVLGWLSSCYTPLLFLYHLLPLFISDVTSSPRTLSFSAWKLELEYQKCFKSCAKKMFKFKESSTMYSNFHCKRGVSKKWLYPSTMTEVDKISLSCCSLYIFSFQNFSFKYNS